MPLGTSKNRTESQRPLKEDSSTDGSEEFFYSVINNDGAEVEVEGKKFKRSLLLSGSKGDGDDCCDGDNEVFINEDHMPVDRFNMVYILFCLLGCGTLLPWNFFITANDYFREKLKSEPELVTTFQNFFSVASFAPNVFLMLINVFLLHKIRVQIRILVAIVVTFVMFALTAGLVLPDTSNDTRMFFIVTLCTVTVINAAGSVLQGALFGLAGMFPQKYIQGVFAGQGLGGLFASGANLASLVGNSSIIYSAFGYFIAAAVVLLLCLVGFVYLMRMDFVKHHLKKQKSCSRKPCKCKDGRHEHMLDWVNEDGMKKINSPRQMGVVQLALFVFRKVSMMSLSAFLTFFVTLAVFPSTTARIVSVVSKQEQTEWHTKYFVPVTCFFLFNSCDYIGRLISGFCQRPGKKGPWLLLLCILRVGFLPLFAFCNAQPRINAPVLFNHDAYPIVFMILFGLSNGYLGSLAMMYGPTMVDHEHSELAGIIMAFSIVAGLATGAAFSFAIGPNL